MAIRVCVGEAPFFLNFCLTLHGQWHICPLCRQLSCGGIIACVGIHPSLAGFIFEARFRLDF